MNTEAKINRKLIGFLLTPSWFSGLISVVAGIGVTVCVIVMAKFSGSDIHQQYLNYQATKADQSLMQSYRTDTLHTLISNAPLMAFWALIGVVVYMLAINIAGAIQQAGEMKSELEYVNVNRNRLLRTAGLHFLVRIIVLAVWAPYILFFFYSVVPYVITLATAGTANSPEGALYALMAVLVTVLTLHVHVILLRLLLLKPRILSRALYVS